jgi:hypothetical protein
MALGFGVADGQDYLLMQGMGRAEMTTLIVGPLALTLWALTLI